MRISSFQNQTFFSSLKNGIQTRPFSSMALLVTTALFNVCKFSIPGYSFLSIKKLGPLDSEGFDDFKIQDIAFRRPFQKTLRHSIMLNEIHVDLNKIFKERLSCELPKQISFDWTVGILNDTESKQRFASFSWYWFDVLRDEFKERYNIKSDLECDLIFETKHEEKISRILQEKIKDVIFESIAKIPSENSEDFLKNKVIGEIKPKLNESFKPLGLQILKIEMRSQ